MIVATRASGVLRAFNDAGYVDVSDVQVALRLGRLAGERNEAVLLAVALAVAALRAGSVCLELGRARELPYEGQTPVDELPWPALADMRDALTHSPLVVGNGRDPLAPLRFIVEDDLLYLTKYYEQEREIARLLDARAQTQPEVRDLSAELGELFPSPAPDRQRIAAGLALSRWTTVLVGGPGTGKTHTVARILALLAKDNPSIRVGLAAPTGKAAAQLEESVRKQADIGVPEVKAVTLHRLLGWLPGAGARYRHNATNRLPFDVVVVDECSMVPLTMMYRLLVALRPTTRLILVGDPDQLASVDAGAVLADLVARRTTGPVPAVIEPDLHAAGTDREPALTDEEHELVRGGVARLSVGRRFNSDIAALAAAVRDGNSDRAIDILRSGSDAVSFSHDDQSVRTDVEDTFARARAAAYAGDAEQAIDASETHRILCAHREGPHGVTGWEREVHGWLGVPTGQWYPGQPLIVSGNDYDLKVFNGDTGVVIADGDRQLAAFRRGGEVLRVHPSQIASVSSAYAITIHRSQGSQYDTVSVILPGPESSLLTRELFYTAITRAKNHVRVVGTEEVVRAAVQRRVLRASGLRR